MWLTCDYHKNTFLGFGFIIGGEGAGRLDRVLARGRRESTGLVPDNSKAETRLPDSIEELRDF